MKKNELVKKIHAHTDARLYKDGYVSIVDILMDLAYLKKEKYEEWRFGRVDYLERVCTCNLHELSLICKEIREYCLGLGARDRIPYTNDGEAETDLIKDCCVFQSQGLQISRKLTRRIMWI